MTRKLPTIQVIDRASRLLDAITRNDQPVTLKILAIETGLHPATAFRILGSMTSNGLVERDDRGRYCLGIRFRLLGNGIHTDAKLRHEAHATMEQLQAQHNETVNLSLRDGYFLTYIERLASAQDGHAAIGKYAPLHATAVGKLLLGHQGEVFCRDYVNSDVFTAVTEHTIVNYERLHEDISVSMQRGYATDLQESTLGRGCVGVLITNSTGSAVAGLSITTTIDKLSDEQLKQTIVTDLTDATRHLKARLGFAETVAA